MMRLSKKDRECFLQVPGTKPFEPMLGRMMKEYVEVPQKILESEDQLKQWLKKSLDYARIPPPKPHAKKGRKKVSYALGDVVV